MTGDIEITKCSCVQRAGGRCCHVAALLYLIRDIRFGGEPKMNIPVTSKPQQWGKGNPNKKKPEIIGKNDYGKKRHENIIAWDPRPAKFRNISQFEKNAFVCNLAKFEQNGDPNPNFIKMVKCVYEDYVLDENAYKEEEKIWVRERIQVLKEKIAYFHQCLHDNFDFLRDTHSLSTEKATHVSSTIDQADSEDWKQKRKFLVTASICYEFSRNVNQFLKNFWRPVPVDLSKVPAIDWGKKGEEKCFEALCSKFGHAKMKKCGLFVSKQYPFLGASPDAIYEDFLIEIKCPFNLRDTSPTDLSKLTKDQLRATFLEKDGQSVRIKRSHKYFLQAQFQLFVTGFQKLKFVV